VYCQFRQMTGKQAMSNGDFNLLPAIAASICWQHLPQVLLLSSASGLLWSLLNRLCTLQSLQVPLGFGRCLGLAVGCFFLCDKMYLRFGS
ncbi:prepilin peptidase, partial [Klebsiella pneumoniae]|uniref:prepilin peptidase n=1 Tax=Klebsiella pneumoniae TaxID=573 RepID=UPI00277A4EE8|nr:prepilin peptidase [Klebsiella pneumoniae]